MYVDKYYPQWLDEALNFDVYHASAAPQVSELRDLLYLDVAAKANIRQSPDRTKDALRLVLLNLYVGWRVGCPIKYSRNSRDYRHHARYGKLFFKIKRVIPIIDALLELGYAQGELGYHFPNDKKQSRMWASARLIGLFRMFEMDGPGLIYHEQPQEIIQLRDNAKIRIGYDDSPATDGMRARLQDYNELIGQQTVEVALDRDSQISRHGAQTLVASEKSGYVKLTIVNLNNSIGINYNILEHRSIDTYTITNTIIDFSLYNYTNTDNFGDLVSHHTGSKRLSVLYPEWDIQDDDDTKARLSDYGIDNLSFVIHYNYLHRVFSRGDFSHGGRFYGAFHQRMPKQLRANITINGEPTVELDYSAHHVRMLYHLSSIDYCGDPYMALCDTKEERKMFKLATLAMVNAKSKSATVGAIRAMVADSTGISFRLAKAKPIIERFQEVHAPISRYLCSDIGCALQNKDSVITDGILTRLTDDGVPCLPIHDSYIVPARHEDLLRQAMFEEYEKTMGYSPIIDRKH
ncbi:MAG: hypothetical protein HGA96_06230 [Desulfobulbaceae bacterium]|nr:hypothetical protein [Desulfobulbaceae bacterium]